MAAASDTTCHPALHTTLNGARPDVDGTRTPCLQILVPLATSPISILALAKAIAIPPALPTPAISISDGAFSGTRRPKSFACRTMRTLGELVASLSSRRAWQELAGGKSTRGVSSFVRCIAPCTFVRGAAIAHPDRSWPTAAGRRRTRRDVIRADPEPRTKGLGLLSWDQQRIRYMWDGSAYRGGRCGPPSHAALVPAHWLGGSGRGFGKLAAQVAIDGRRGHAAVPHSHDHRRCSGDDVPTREDSLAGRPHGLFVDH